MDDSLQFKARQLFDQKARSTGFSTAFCGAHTTMYVFDAFGDIYEHVTGSGPGLAISRLCEA